MTQKIATMVATVLVLMAFSTVPVVAQTTYQSWDNPDQASDGAGAGEERLKSFMDQLDALLSQAENDKAADPVFLRDLRELLTCFDSPTMNLVLHDDFSDGDFAQNPVWAVGGGRYFLEEGWGLRNALETAKASSDGTKVDPGVQLLANILGQALGGSTTKTTTAATSTTQPNNIFTDVTIANAFSLELSMTSWVGEGRLIMGPYQGSNRNTGYRLVYNIGGAVELIAKSSGGTRIIGTAGGPFTLEDKKVHTFAWTRDTGGNMVVTLDGDQLFALNDTSFRDPFRGFGMATRGGDFIVKSVDIYAEQ